MSKVIVLRNGRKFKTSGICVCVYACMCVVLDCAGGQSLPSGLDEWMCVSVRVHVCVCVCL